MQGTESQNMEPENRGAVEPLAGEGVREATVGGMEVVTGSADTLATIGRVFWVTVGGCLVPHEKAEKLWETAGLPKETAPTAPRPVDAFKVAVDLAGREFAGRLIVKVKSIPVGKPNTKGETPQKPWGRVVLLNKVVGKGVPALGMVSYAPEDRTSTGRVESTTNVESEVKQGEGESENGPSYTLTDEDRALFTEFVERTRTLYDIYATNNTDVDVRMAVMRHLKVACRPFMMRSGGSLYFAAEPFVGDLSKVGAFLASLEEFRSTGASKSELAYLKVQAGDKATVAQRFEEAIGGRADEIIENVRATLSGQHGKVHPSELKAFMAEIQDLDKLREQYEDALEIKVEKAKVTFDLMRAMAVRLASMVESTQ